MHYMFICRLLGLEYKLGNKTHDDTTRRWQKCYIPMFVCRLQGRP